MAPGNMIHLKSKDSIKVNEWTHFSFSYDGTGDAKGIKLFKNGRLFPYVTELNNLSKSIQPVSASGLKIEQRPVLVGKTYEGSTGDNGLFMGKMDELRIYGAALTPLEVKILYGKSSEEAVEIEKEYWITNHPKSRILNEELRSHLEQWRTAMEPVLEVMVMEEMKMPRKTFLYNRGDYSSPGAEVGVNTPEVLPKMSEGLPKNRLGLAQWLFKKDHPLTARVAVNRYWQMLFGNGLVRTQQILVYKVHYPPIQSYWIGWHYILLKIIGMYVL